METLLIVAVVILFVFTLVFGFKLRKAKESIVEKNEIIANLENDVQTEKENFEVCDKEVLYLLSHYKTIESAREKKKELIDEVEKIAEKSPYKVDEDLNAVFRKSLIKRLRIKIFQIEDYEKRISRHNPIGHVEE